MTLVLDPARTALLVMDYQPALVDTLPQVDRQLALVGEALQVARERGAHVAYVRVALSDDDYANLPEHSPFAERIRRLGRVLDADAPGMQVHPRIAPQDGDVVVRKSRVGAFSTTDLHEQLREQGVDTIVLAGFSTSGVVLSTVRDGADRDYRVVVLSDACTDPDPEVHTFLVERIFPRQATVLTTAALAPALRADA